MRSLKKIIALALVLTATVFAGCQNQEIPAAPTESVEKRLAGTWTTVLDRSQEHARTLLENIQLYDEEFTLADLSSLHYTKTVTFDGSYYIFAYDAEACRENVREFYEGLFDTLYQNLTTLNGVYAGGQRPYADLLRCHRDLHKITKWGAPVRSAPTHL